MKKTYITPEALVVSLFANSPILQDMSLHDELGQEVLVKEQAGTDGSTTGGKSIWDEEW